MEALDVLLAPISPERPCGEDITWDRSLAEIRSSIRGKVDRKIEETSGGKRIVEEVEEPNWSRVLGLCEVALKRSKHLAVCVIYATARLQLDGLEGMAQGITLISRVVQQYWETLYPMLVPEHNFDPSPRFGWIENLSQIGATPEEDPLRYVERLRRTPLGRSPQVGIINLLSLQDANPNSDSPVALEVRGAMASVFREAPEEIRKGAAAVNAALQAMSEMSAFLTNVAGIKEVPTLARLEQQLELIREIYQMSGNSETVGTSAPNPVVQVQPTPQNVAEPVVAIAGEIRGSADVLRCLDRICEYYKRVEPSSPVPLILLRARRLVDQSFMDVLNDLAASAVDQVKVITGQQ